MNSIYYLFADNTNPDSRSAKLRSKRFKLFLKIMKVSATSKILDVGGTEATWLDFDFKKNVTLLNIRLPQNRISEFTYVKGDACNMNIFEKNEFDIVFSNSVIEHVGSIDKQKLFAKEIQRVGTTYWVQTPYRHFPIEPHFVFPFFQYLPIQLQKKIGLKWKTSHYKMSGAMNDDILIELDQLRLINLKEMKQLFNDSFILKEKYGWLIKSLIAIRK